MQQFLYFVLWSAELNQLPHDVVLVLVLSDCHLISSLTDSRVPGILCKRSWSSCYLRSFNTKSIQVYWSLMGERIKQKKKILLNCSEQLQHVGEYGWSERIQVFSWNHELRLNLWLSPDNDSRWELTSKKNRFGGTVFALNTVGRVWCIFTKCFPMELNLSNF